MDYAVDALTVYNGELIAGGRFLTAGGVAANCIASWNGTVWQPLGAGMGGSYHQSLAVIGLTAFNGDLIVGGDFTRAGDLPSNRIARWDGSAWRPLGSGMNTRVFGLMALEGGLIASGEFTTAGGESCNRIAMWDGAQWRPLGSGMNNAVYWGLAAYNGELIAGGRFTTAGGLPCNRIARWTAAVGACCFGGGQPCQVLSPAACQTEGGTYLGDGSTCELPDCNGNGVNDACDVSSGTSPDCNANGLPDDCDIQVAFGGTCDGATYPPCDTDYNTNGVPDHCEACGDLNGDEEVHEADYWIFVDAFGWCAGSPRYNALADLDGSGCVNLVDFQAWLMCYQMANGREFVAPKNRPAAPKSLILTGR